MNLLGELYEDRRQMEGAVLTTFPFTSPYFEDVVQRALSRKGIERPVVLTDPETYASTLVADRESAPSSVGRSYLLEPVVMEAGYRFHPKLFFFGSSDRSYAYIGSANLTEQAFTNNQEVITYLECEADDDSESSSFNALAGCREFLVELLDGYGDEIGKIASKRIESVLTATAWLTSDEREPSDIDIIHSLSKPILPEVEEKIEQRGESIEEVHIASPYYGGGLRIPHQFTDVGIKTTLWLQQRHTQIDSEAVDEWVDAPEATVEIFESERFVHGKVIQFQTESNVYCLFGSPNASQAALLGTPHDDETPRGNVELAVLRRATGTDHFSYLFEGEPFTVEDRPSLSEFTPGIEQLSFDGVSKRQSDQTIALLDIGFAESEVFSGGQLHGQVRLPADNPLGGKIRITPIDDERSPVEIDLQPRYGDGETSRRIRSFSRRVTDSVEVSTFKRPARAVFIHGEQESEGRWMAIESVTMTEETESAVSNAGTETVWKSLYDVYFGDIEQRDEKLEFLGILADRLTSLESRMPRSTEESEKEDREDDDDSLKLPKWSRNSRSRSPNILLEQYYENWYQNIRNIGGDLDPKEPDQLAERIELIGDLLAGCNRTSVWLEAFRADLQRIGEAEDVPLHLSREYTRELYSRREPGFDDENTALVAWLCNRVRRMGSDRTMRELQRHVLPNVIFGAIIAYRQIAEDMSTVRSYYGRDFEQLVATCHSGSIAESKIDVNPAVERVRDLTSEIRAGAERSDKLRRKLPSELVSESPLRSFATDLVR